MGITMLGVHHGDIDKRERLKEAFSREKPALITLESRHSDIPVYQAIIDKHRKELEELLSEGLTRDAHALLSRSLIDEAFQDVLGSMQLGAELGVPVELIEHPTFPLDAGGNSLREEPVEFLNDISLAGMRAKFDASYKYIFHLVNEEDEFMKDMYLEVNQQKFVSANGEHRDDYPASKLLAALEKTRGTIVHVCGGLHLLSDAQERTLYSKIRHANPKRTLLWEYDQNYVQPGRLISES